MKPFSARRILLPARRWLRRLLGWVAAHLGLFRLRRTVFTVNLILMALISACLFHPDSFGFASQALNYSYDSLTHENYRWAVLEGNESAPLADSIRLVLFDSRTYNSSYTSGFWTPRGLAGETLLGVLRRGARTVIFDFSFRRRAPVVLRDGVPYDDDLAFIASFRQAAQEARDAGALILLPETEWPEIRDIVREFPGAVRFACFGAYRTGDDGTVRKARWHDPEHGTLSAALEAYVHQNFPPESREEARQEIFRLLDGNLQTPRLLPPEKAALLAGDSQSASRIVFRLLPREAVRAVDPEAKVRSRGTVFHPSQLKGTSLRPDLTGKIVLMGTDNSEIGDMHRTVFGEISGVYILANIVNMTERDLFCRQDLILDLALVAAVILSFSLIFAYLPAVLTLICTLLFTFISPMISQAVYNHTFFFCDIWLAVVLVGGLNSVYGMLDNVTQLLEYFRERLRIRKRRHQEAAGGSGGTDAATGERSSGETAEGNAKGASGAAAESSSNLTAKSSVTPAADSSGILAPGSSGDLTAESTGRSSPAAPDSGSSGRTGAGSGGRSDPGSGLSPGI